jgi:aminoglycoside phosphotransferase (APT) family kinase protein
VELVMHVDPVLADFARSEVTKQLGSSSRVSRVEALQVGGHDAVLLLTVEPSSRRLVLRVAGPDDRRVIDYERTASVTALAQAAGTPVPAVLAVDTSYRAGPWQYLLLEHVDGLEWRHVSSLLSDDEVRPAHRQIATALLAIQSVAFSSFGELDDRGDPVGDDLLSAVRHRAELRIEDEHARRSFNQLLDREAGLFVGGQVPRLCHDDLHHANLIFRASRGGWRLAGVLDWDKAWAGPGESDVARMAFWDDITGPGFWEVYRAAVPEVEGESQRRLVYQLLWCLEYDDTSARHRADTEALRRELRLP